MVHHCVLSCQAGQVAMVIQFTMENQGATSEAIKEWVNSRTGADQFTPLHLASFKGNMDAAKTLIAYGSDPQAINAFGLSMLHVAAQGDAANSCYFFMSQGLDLNVQDHRGSTPLHWACYSKSEIALSYLLAWNPELDLRDNDGYTPLHLAVKSVDEVECTRPVRFLLIRGANKDIRDENQNTPLDLVENGEVV